MPIVNRIADLQAEIAEWRHDLHAHPELLYDVQRTAASVADKLKAFGCDEVVPGIGRTGVVGVIHGRKGKSDKVIGLRADMDALPIEEANDLPYKSTVPGKMHACGHDGHTAMLLGAARYLAETRNFAGTAVVIFQPAEEGGAGGKAMVDDGMMERFRSTKSTACTIIPACRSANSASGAARSWRRPTMCRSTSKAKAAHAARPHLGIDTVLVGAQIVNNLQSIVSRNVDPLEVGGGVDLHVPRRQYRQRHSADRAAARHRAQPDRPRCRIFWKSASRKLSRAPPSCYGAKVTVKYRRGYPVLKNHRAQTDFAAVGRERDRRQGQGRHRHGADDGGGGFLLHAQRAARRLHLRRQRRQRGPASPGLQLQRRRDPGRDVVLGEAGGDGAAGVSG